MWREVRQGETLSMLSSVRRVRDLHDELIQEINRRGVRWVRGRIYPPPPLPGITTNDLIVTPITNVDELQKLGRAQHNCVASYARRVLAGNNYIYRVTTGNGHVCTLCLVKAANGLWRVAEFRGVCNRPAPAEAIRPLHRWLATAQKPLHPATNSEKIATFSEEGQVAVFPSPPFTGHVGGGVEIVPLCDPQMLNACGGEIIRHQAEIETGRACAYRVVTPTDRCVMVIARNRSLFWRIKEIRSEDGTRVHGDTLSAMANWLSKSQGRYR
jgi:hypothetical protein